MIGREICKRLISATNFKTAYIWPVKITQISPLVKSVPLKKYGGTERLVHALTDDLVLLGT